VLKTNTLPDRDERVKVCDELFELHNHVNQVIGAAVTEIMHGADIKAIVRQTGRAIIQSAAETAERLTR